MTDDTYTDTVPVRVTFPSTFTWWRLWSKKGNSPMYIYIYILYRDSEDRIFVCWCAIYNIHVSQTISVRRGCNMNKLFITSPVCANDDFSLLWIMPVDVFFSDKKQNKKCSTIVKCLWIFQCTNNCSKYLTFILKKKKKNKCLREKKKEFFNINIYKLNNS